MIKPVFCICETKALIISCSSDQLICISKQLPSIIAVSLLANLPEIKASNHLSGLTDGATDETKPRIQVFSRCSSKPILIPYALYLSDQAVRRGLIQVNGKTYFLYMQNKMHRPALRKCAPGLCPYFRSMVSKRSLLPKPIVSSSWPYSAMISVFLVVKQQFSLNSRIPKLNIIRNTKPNSKEDSK